VHVAAVPAAPVIKRRFRSSLQLLQQPGKQQTAHPGGHSANGRKRLRVAVNPTAAVPLMGYSGLRMTELRQRRVEELRRSEELRGKEKLRRSVELPGTEELRGSKKLRRSEELPGTEELRGTKKLRRSEKLPGTEELPRSEELPGSEELRRSEELRGTEELHRAEELRRTEEQRVAMIETCARNILKARRSGLTTIWHPRPVAESSPAVPAVPPPCTPHTTCTDATESAVTPVEWSVVVSSVGSPPSFYQTPMQTPTQNFPDTPPLQKLSDTPLQTLPDTPLQTLPDAALQILTDTPVNGKPRRNGGNVKCVSLEDESTRKGMYMHSGCELEVILFVMGKGTNHFF